MAKTPHSPETTRADSDPLWQLEYDIATLRRSRGALRAVQCLVQPWRFAEAQEVENLMREDLAQLLEVIHCDLTLSLDALECDHDRLRGFGRVADQAVEQARRKQ